MSDQTESQTVIYVPEAMTSRGFFTIYINFFTSVWRSRQLTWQLFRRDFSGTYRKSFLRIGWIFLLPIASSVSWLLLNYIGVLRPGAIDIAYPVYLLIGTSLYGFMVAIFNSVATALSGSQAFINQVKYPHEALIMKQTLVPITNFAISFSMVLIISFFIALEFKPAQMLFPIFLAPLIMFAVALGLLMSMIYIVVADMSYIMNTAFGLLVYLSPILYSIDAIPQGLQALIKYNPISYLICVPRDFLISGELRDGEAFACSSIFAFGLLLIAIRMFTIGEKKLIEKMV